MYKGEKIIILINKNKSIIWGLFLSTIIFKYAVGNIFLGIMLSLFLVQLLQNKTFIFKRSLLPIFIYFLWGVVSLFWTTDFSNTIKGISSTFPLIIIPILISQYPEFDLDDLTKSIRIFSIALLLYFLVCFINASFLFLNDKLYAHFFYHDLVSVFNNNAIYISLAVSVCILFNYSFQNKTKKDYFIIALLVFFLLVLSSKNIIITTFLLILSSLYINKENRKSFFLMIVVFVVIVLFLTLSENPIKQRFLNELNFNIPYIWLGQDFYNYNFSGFEIRLFQWRLMKEMIVNNQVGILGLGLNNVNYLLEQYFSYYNLYKGYFYINFHNQYLQTLAELGFVGLGLLLNVFLGLIYMVFSYKNIYGLVFILIFMSAFFTESFLCRQKGIFLFTTIYSLIFVLSIKRN
jgi:O-antigen ligase